MTDDTISRQAAIELFKDDIAAVNELNNLPSLPDRMKYVQESVNTIMNTCKSDSIKDKAFRNAARLIQNAIDGETHDFEVIEDMLSAQRWIPCSERCPDKSEWYLVTAEWDDGLTAVTKDRYVVGNGWTCEVFGAKCLAWMPLPTPYREGGQNDSD